MTWPVEPIPDGDLLYMRVHRGVIDRGEIPAGVFPTKSHTSTDWSRYATPAETRRRARQPAANYAVIQLLVGDVRELRPLEVQHSPIEPSPEEPKGNRAHADILHLDVVRPFQKTEIRAKLWNAAAWYIAIDDPVEDEPT